ncbi:MAG: regulatory iron-sulfur-containing complex subunit RicT [Patescibacteria group bacterium]|nr:stage 0 sporulation protein [Patescibacteria group bacterium]
MAIMTKIYGILSFYHYKALYIPAQEGDKYKRGDMVVFSDEDGGNEVGQIISLSDDAEEIAKNMAVLRLASDNDLQKMKANTLSGRDAMEKCRNYIEEFSLNMYLIDAIYSLDGAKINFVFTSDDRVDFRDLVKKLAQRFQRQIHLQQIGPRDKARFVRGYGKCGRRLCCGQAVGKLKSITMDMVRVQNMSNKGSEKLSGVCGKLMCCLAYEVKSYDQLKKSLPPYMSSVTMKDGKTGVVRGVDVLNQKVRVENKDGEYIVVPVADLKIVKPVKND